MTTGFAEDDYIKSLEDRIAELESQALGAGMWADAQNERIAELEKVAEAAAYLLRKGAHYPSPLCADEEATRESLRAAGYLKEKDDE